MGKKLLLGILGVPLLLAFALAPAKCQGFFTQFLEQTPLSPYAHAVDAYLAALKDRGSSDDVLNHLTSLKAWNNPFKPAPGGGDPGESATEYECKSGCGCSPRTGNPVVAKKGTSLMFFNECGQWSHGTQISPDLFRADEWNMSVSLYNDGRSLKFVRPNTTTVWERPGPVLPEKYPAPGYPPSSSSAPDFSLLPLCASCPPRGVADCSTGCRTR
jgi:hypothetical protein